MKKALTVREICIFAILGALMYGSKILMEALPNIHLLAMFTMTITLVYRKKALIPIYLYVLINGFFAGFATWWIPYLYIWTILWGVTMILPKQMPDKISMVIYPLICGLHGLLFSVMYVPFQALFYGLDWNGVIGWIVAGFPFDVIHAVGDLCAGLLVLPLSKVLKKAENMQTNR